ncbi:MAG: DUF2333 family protein [Rhodospirillales bacterium]|nr:DUF2333 family protein [Acetobacter sp.]
MNGNETGMMTAMAKGAAAVPAGPKGRRRLWRWVALVTAILCGVAWFGVGAVVHHRVDDSLTFAPTERTAKGSMVIDVAAGLITREVDQYGWQSNDPWFYSTALTDNAAHFQSGMMWAISRLTSELTDHIGRLGAVGRIDEDLQRANGLLRYPGDVWVLDLRSMLPTPSEMQYRSGRDSLLAYNNRLSAGRAVFEARPDNLVFLLNRIARDLGSESESIEKRLAESSFVFSNSADDLFYQVKGAVYAYAVLFNALESDFGTVIKDFRLQSLWAATRQSLAEAATLRPWIVLDSPPGSGLFANHLAIEGYHVLRAKARLNDLVRALQI